VHKPPSVSKGRTLACHRLDIWIAGLNLLRMVLEEAEIRELLKTARVIAVVGLSPDPEKPSNSVSRYMKEKGYRIIPVNPAQDEIIGEKCYKALSEIPEQVDIVDIFMRSEKALPVVEEALTLKPKAIWLQLGIRNDEARRLVEQTDVGYVETSASNRSTRALSLPELRHSDRGFRSATGSCQPQPASFFMSLHQSNQSN